MKSLEEIQLKTMNDSHHLNLLVANSSAMRSGAPEAPGIHALLVMGHSRVQTQCRHLQLLWVCDCNSHVFPRRWHFSFIFWLWNSFLPLFCISFRMESTNVLFGVEHSSITVLSIFNSYESYHAQPSVWEIFLIKWESSICVWILA